MAPDLLESGSLVLPQAPLLRTKLYAPAPRTDRVHRQRLFERLDAGRRTALSLVSAPAGFGKSTLISDWLQHRERPAAWLSLDATDSDLRRFLSYLGAALERPLPGVGRCLAPALAAPRLSEDPEPLLAPLLNELWECPGCILVLDDYHVIEADEVHSALSWLLERLPPEVHLVITTRVDPPLPLPRLRARGLLCELRAEDLRFTFEEAAAFLRETMGLDVTPREVEALERRTEGWIAGLQMAALSLRGRDDVSAFIAGFTGSHRFVLDYLTEEVLDRQPADRMDFLLRTSILPRLSGPLCDAVIGGDGRGDSQEILESLETANLFLIPLDDRRGWYRYHHLFASLLQDELGRRALDGELGGLHRRASDWFEAHGFPDEAMDHAAAACDWERAARIIGMHSAAVMHRGEVSTLGRWFSALPAECYERQPRLLIGRAITLFAAMRFPEFAAVLQELERVAEGSDDPELLAGLDGMRALALSGQADHPGVVAFATRALERLPERETMRGLITLVLGLSLARISGESARALEVLEEAAAINAASGNLTLYGMARSEQALLELLHGQLDRCLERCRQALALFPPGTADLLPGASQAQGGLARAHLERGELDRALEIAALAVRLSRAGDVGGHHVKNLGILAFVHMARSDSAAAREVTAEIVAYMARARMALWEVVIESIGICIDLAEARRVGRPDLVERALRWTEERHLLEWDSLRGRLVPDLPADSTYLTVAHVLVAAGRRAQALELLGALQDIAEEDGWVRSQIEIAILQALALQEAPAALEPLARALALAAPGGFLQLFVSEGAPMARLLAAYEQARPGSLDTPFGRKLREALSLESEAGAAEPVVNVSRPAQAPGAEALSDREVEVLRAVASGLSNAEAAKRLYLSPFTVKKHLENIYGKLGVRNRTEAIARAQGLGWLERAGA